MSDEARWFMDYRNADGSVAEMCGNGIRVFARYLVSAGLVEEVSGLLEHGLRDGVTASRALGYAQVIAELDAGGDGSAARELTFIGTRRYVRRQRSWFRRDHRIAWLDGAAAGNVDQAVRLWRDVS